MEEMKKDIGDLGEFGLISHLTKDLKIKHSTTIKGIGDDAAVLDYQGSELVITTDLLAEGVHFNLIYTPLRHLGYKSVVVNLSDVYAMNAIPKQITVSIAISKKHDIAMLEELYAGIKLACDRYGVDLVGGDTTSSFSGLIISITALGSVAKDKVVYRNGANETDLICVTGNLGAAYAGLQILERESTLFEKEGVQPILKDYEYVLERQLKPEARKDLIDYFEEKNLLPTSMIDISDGLSSEIMHICRQSGKGCELYEDKIPVDEQTSKVAEELGINPLTCALNGGEDYELLFTVPLSEYKNVNDHPFIHIIGHITPEKGKHSLILESGQEIELKAQGWNPILS